MRRSGTPTLESFGDICDPQEAVEPILAPPVRAALLEWLTEIWAASELEAVGLRPRRKALFYGGPGTGKTTLAHHLAARLGLPMLLVRPDRVVESWLGQTGQNLGAIFDLARPEPLGEGPVVLFFDEFEALGRKRYAARQGADREMNNVVDTLLQRIEAHDGIIIAATNMADEIDPAIWRRFDIQIEIALPTQRERELILARYLQPYGIGSRALTALADACATASPALLRQLCEGIKRNFVLAERLGWDTGRSETMSRVLRAVEPHRDLGKPRLWAHGAADHAVSLLPWPMPLAADVKDDADGGVQGKPAGSIVSLRDVRGLVT